MVLNRLVGVVALAGLILMGCDRKEVSERTDRPTTRPSATQPAAALEQPGQANDAQLAGRREPGAAELAEPRDFAREAASAGMLEVQLGQYAAANAGTDSVKRFGQTMVEDHGRANDELKQLAQQKGWDLPSQMMPRHQQTHDRLSKLNGNEFDRLYMGEMVRDHAAGVVKFRQQSESGKDAELRQWAGRYLPILERHLAEARRISQAVGAAVPEANSPAGAGKPR